MFYVYVLYSLKDNKLYKGFTSNIMQRFIKHNSGGSTSTAHRKPFVLVHIEQFTEKSAALKRELYLKSAEGGKKLHEYLKKQNIIDADNMLNIG